MALKPIAPAINGSGQRKCQSWIDAFVDYTDNLESPVIYRRWAAISTIAAVLEQKVWADTGSYLYPNVYCFLIGNAGIGKTRAISAANKILREVEEHHFAPTSMTMASLVDCLVEAKRSIVKYVGKESEMIIYNTMTVFADELSAFMPKYDAELIGGLTTFYDVEPYAQARRMKDLRAKIARPQLTILTGSTPSNLLTTFPDFVWEQGLMSRVIMVYSQDRPMRKIFDAPVPVFPKDMVHDLNVMNGLEGQFDRTDEYRDAIHNWRESGTLKGPKHPKLQHYNARRVSHLIKLSMISAVDQSNDLTLKVGDFNRAMQWLLEAEGVMPHVFEQVTFSADSKAMDEVLHFVQAFGDKGVGQHQVINMIRKKITYGAQALHILEVMEQSGMLLGSQIDPKTGLKFYRALVIPKGGDGGGASSPPVTEG